MPLRVRSSAGLGGQIENEGIPVKVWVLVLYMSSSWQGGPTIIDNIESRAECERVRAQIVKDPRVVDASTYCVEVRKVVAR